LSPGSLFTSTIPALLGVGTREALAEFDGPVVYVANVMTQPGETSGFAISDHVRAIREHVGDVVTDVLVHVGELPRNTLELYEAERAAPAVIDRDVLNYMNVRLLEADLLAPSTGGGVRHDPDRLAKEVCEAALVRL
ncbi:MAG: 2-phospho-L-lactate transferase CofD family protein, partial [Actinomycetota bacterium]|nr:2-phospho-L-lactate transferase CofD family protein [Actinomycetota bacterium]